MIRLALLFLVIALVAAFFGFPLLANYSFGAAQLLFVVFLVLAVLTVLAGAFRGRPMRELW